MSAAQTRRAIGEAGAAEILAQGYAGASMASIASRLNLTKGALTRHFPTKADFAHHYVDVLRTATDQAARFAKEQYPDCGACRLLLYFKLLVHYRMEHSSVAAGLVLFADPASPAFESADIIRDWLAITEDALQECDRNGELVGDLTVREAAELFLLTHLGGFFFGKYVELYRPNSQPLRFVQIGLRAVGHVDPGPHAEQVLTQHYRPPALVLAD